MRNWLAILATGACVFSLSSCYHATVETGRPPSGQTVERPWASGFVLGLVPPSTVETAAACPNGVARVETQLSFLNQLVSGLTFGIYTPMTIRVDCAAPVAASGSVTPVEIVSLPGTVSRAELAQALSWAAQRSRNDGRAVQLEFSLEE